MDIIKAWLKRVFGGSGKEVPCALCRCAIPPADLEKGVALVIARRQFCSGCVEEITRKTPQPGVAGWRLEIGSSSTVLFR